MTSEFIAVIRLLSLYIVEQLDLQTGYGTETQGDSLQLAIRLSDTSGDDDLPLEVTSPDTSVDALSPSRHPDTFEDELPVVPADTLTLHPDKPADVTTPPPDTPVIDKHPETPAHHPDTLEDKYPLVYTPPAEANITGSGHPFGVDRSLLAKIGLPPKNFFELNSSTVRNFDFITACDRSHFEESGAAISSIHTMFPGYQVHYFDIGLTSDQIEKVRYSHIRYNLLTSRYY